jgi:hypothetical protein
VEFFLDAWSVTFRIVVKPLIFAGCVGLVCASLCAETPPWLPSPGHTQVAIWPRAVPDAQPLTGPEELQRR